MARKLYSFEYREQIVALVQTGRSIASVTTESDLTDHLVRCSFKDGR